MTTTTETTLAFDRRGSGVPIVLRTGKRLARKVTARRTARPAR